MARRTLLLIASILTAALGTALIWLYVQGAEKRAVEDSALVPAAFLSQDVTAGTSPLAAVMIRQVPPDVAVGAVTSTQELGKQVVKSLALKNQVLLRSMLGVAADSSGGSLPGRAVSLSIADPSRLPAELKPGDLVDVIELTKDTPTPLLTKVTVRTIGTFVQPGAGTTTAGNPGTNAAAPNGTVPTTIVELNATPDQALKLYGMVGRGSQAALILYVP